MGRVSDSDWGESQIQIRGSLRSSFLLLRCGSVLKLKHLSPVEGYCDDFRGFQIINRGGETEAEGREMTGTHVFLLRHLHLHLPRLPPSRLQNDQNVLVNTGLPWQPRFSYHLIQRRPEGFIAGAGICNVSAFSKKGIYKSKKNTK